MGRGKFKNVNHAKYTASQIGLLILKKLKIFRNKGNAGILINGQFSSNEVIESVLKRLHIQDHVYMLAWHDPEKAIETALSDFKSGQTVSTIHKSLPSFRKTVGIQI